MQSVIIRKSTLFDVFRLLCFVLCIQSSALAQTFKNDSVYVGHFKYHDSLQIKHTFVLNCEACVISSVKADCSCVLNEIANKTDNKADSTAGRIRITFEPYKIGFFKKSFDVYLKKATKNIKEKLYIYGYIEGSIGDSMRYSYRFPNFYAQNKYINFGRIALSDTAFKKEHELYNPISDTLYLSLKGELPNYLYVRIPKYIAPNELRKMALFFHSNMRGAKGHIQEQFKLEIKQDSAMSIIPFILNSFVE